MDKLTKFPPLIFFICLIGTLVLMMNISIKPESKKWYGPLFASDYFPPLNGFPDTSDADEGRLIYMNLEKAYKFKNSSLHSGCKNLYWLPGNRHSIITVFEIIDSNEQQKIIKAARDIKKKFQTREFSIEFYATETGPNPTDQFLWKVRID